MKKLVYLFLALATVVCSNAATPSADAVMNSAASKIRGAKGISASFSSTGTSSVSGTIVASGNKFKLTAGGMTTWFDGKTMWSYNPRSQEVSVMNPTAREIAESNPLSYVAGWSGMFKASFSQTKPSSGYSIILTAKNSSVGIKGAVVTLSAQMIPQKIVITQRNGKKETITISSVKFTSAPAASTFTFKKSAYPKATVVDLR